MWLHACYDDITPRRSGSGLFGPPEDGSPLLERSPRKAPRGRATGPLAPPPFLRSGGIKGPPFPGRLLVEGMWLHLHEVEPGPVLNGEWRVVRRGRGGFFVGNVSTTTEGERCPGRGWGSRPPPSGVRRSPPLCARPVGGGTQPPTEGVGYQKQPHPVPGVLTPLCFFPPVPNVGRVCRPEQYPNSKYLTQCSLKKIQPKPPIKFK